MYNPFHEVFPRASKLVHEAYMQRIAFEVICDQTDQDKRFKVRPALTEYPTENYIMFNQISDVKCNLKFNCLN